MISWFENYQLWLKSFHIIFIIAWMAGLLYLPRLFVYHSMAPFQSTQCHVFQKMEYRLYHYIMVPSMILSLASGIFLATIQGTWSFQWMHLKLFCVFALIVFHHVLNYWRQQLAQGTCSHQERFFRIVNEIPTILLILIVISVVVKPF